jgi:hypothetical protein
MNVGAAQMQIGVPDATRNSDCMATRKAAPASGSRRNKWLMSLTTQK